MPTQKRLDISSRLKQVRKHLGYSQTEFARILEIPQTTYSKYELGASVPEEILTFLFRIFHLNLNWLVAGQGTMFRDGSECSECEKSSFEDKYTHLVPMINLKVSAGVGSEWESGEGIGDMLPIPMHIYKMYKSYDLAGVTVSGDSMEPTLRDGEPVVYARGVLEGDGIYVISILNELFVKRLSIDQLDKTVTIISDNPMYSKKVYPLDREGFLILGKVIFWLHMEQRLRILN